MTRLRRSDKKHISDLRFSRRDALRIFASIQVGVLGIPLRSANAHTMDEPDFAVLLDTLIPSDTISRSATEVGVHEFLTDLGQSVENYFLLLDEGMKWLTGRSRRTFARSFAQLDLDQRDALIGAALAEPVGTLPQVFMSRLRMDALTIYYAIPENWASLGFDGPIQPQGFSDFDRPPA